MARPGVGMGGCRRAQTLEAGLTRAPHHLFPSLSSSHVASCSWHPCWPSYGPLKFNNQKRAPLFMQSLLLLPCFQSDLCRIKAKFHTVPCLPYLVSLSPLPVPVPIPTTRNHVDSPHELFRLSRGLGQDAGLLCLEPPSQARSLARRPLTEPAAAHPRRAPRSLGLRLLNKEEGLLP